MKMILSVFVLCLVLGCKNYSEDMPNTDSKEKLSYSFGYNYSDWLMYDANNTQINFDSNKYDRIPKIMEVDIKVISKSPKTATIYMWYGGSDNTNTNGETPMTYNPEKLVDIINLAEKDKDYKIYPPKNDAYKAWSIPEQPIATLEVNNKNVLNINLYLEPETYLSITKKDIYLIDTNNSFVERKYRTNYGIYGGMTYGMKFIKHSILRRVFINAHSSYSNKDINFDSDFINVSTTYE